MAGGWARDEAVNDQIEITTREAVARARLRAGQLAGRAAAATCAECDEPIPEARRRAVPGVQLCIACQAGQDRMRKPAAGINRRASKDALLK